MTRIKAAFQPVSDWYQRDADGEGPPDLAEAIGMAVDDLQKDRAEALKARQLRQTLSLCYNALRGLLKEGVGRHTPARSLASRARDKAAITLGKVSRFFEHEGIMPQEPFGYAFHCKHWTPMMLSGGYRPLLLGEMIDREDECLVRGVWHPVPRSVVGTAIGGTARPTRTTRALLPFITQECAQDESGPPAAGQEEVRLRRLLAQAGICPDCEATMERVTPPDGSTFSCECRGYVWQREQGDAPPTVPRLLERCAELHAELRNLKEV